MKKKLALLLASVMSLSTVSINLFAATENHLTKTPALLPDKTLFVEEDLLGAGLTTGNAGESSLFTNGTSGGALSIARPGKIVDQDEVKYIVDGADLVIQLRDNVKPEDSIRVRLTNAKWFFRNQADLLHPGLPLSTEKYVPEARNNTKTSNEPVITYDVTRGLWVPYGTNDTRGVYYRGHAVGLSGLPAGLQAGVDVTTGKKYNKKIEVPYTLEVQGSSDSEAVITLKGFGDGPESISSGAANDFRNVDGNIIRIPLVIRSTETESVTVEIVDSNLTTISTGVRYQLAQSGATATKTTVDDPKTGRDEFPLNRLIINEQRLNSMESGWFSITAPSGFEFSDNINRRDNAGREIVRAYIERGLTWIGGATGEGTKGTLSASYGNYNSSDTGSNPFNARDYALRFRRMSNGDYDFSVLEVYIDVEKSTSLAGSLYFEGLVLTAEEGAPWGDVNLRIENLRDSAVVTEETFKAGTRTDWTMMFTTAGDIPTLVNGRYVDEDSANPSDKEHKTAEIVFKENSTNAWFSGRRVDFVLSEGAKVRKMRIVSAENLLVDRAKGTDLNTELEEPNLGNVTINHLIGTGNDTGYYGQKYYPNDAKRHGYVTIDGDTISINNITIEQNEKAEIRMHLWVSIQSGFEGDLKLTASRSAIPTENELEPITIAKVVSPITVTSKVTDVKIGYQYYRTNDIRIEETAAGMLKKGKTLNLSITDYIDNEDMKFTPGATYEVAAGDIKLKNFETQNVGSATTVLGQTSRGIRFDIATASTQASAIDIKNVQVKIDRTVPESTMPYQVIAWGTAVAENYGVKRDQFQNIAGVATDYIKVVTAANDKGGILANVVSVTIDDPVIKVGPETYTMDTAAYISAASNSTMVPARFISVALGVSAEKVDWDRNKRTVTIDASQSNSTRIIQFTIGSDQISINGISTTMYSPDGLAVRSEIKDDRSFIPMRALGYALGVDVGWDAETRTATYNPEKVGVEPATGTITDEAGVSPTAE